MRCRDPRVVWFCILARFKAAPCREVGKGSAGLPDFAAVASPLQMSKGMAAWDRSSYVSRGCGVGAEQRLHQGMEPPPQGACMCSCFRLRDYRW